MKQHRVLFVCMGNICRSPTAEGFFRHHVARASAERDFMVDSAGTHGYHVGQPPDERAVAEASRFGVDISGLRARCVDSSDFDRFDWIVGMDHQNVSLLRRMAPVGNHDRISLMMSFDAGTGEDEVPDPYYGDQRGFTYMCQLLDRATLALLERLRSGIFRVPE